MEVFPAAILAENERNLPFLATTTILMESVKHGAGRETAHGAIKEHALAAAQALRKGDGEASLLGPAGGRPPDRPGQEGAAGDHAPTRPGSSGRPPTRWTPS